MCVYDGFFKIICDAFDYCRCKDLRYFNVTSYYRSKSRSLTICSTRLLKRFDDITYIKYSHIKWLFLYIVLYLIVYVVMVMHPE